MQALYSVLSHPISYLTPEPVKVGYTDDNAYKPRIVITGEKTDLFVLDALKTYTTQTPIWVSLSDMAIKSKDYDLDKDLLILIIHKQPGNTPIRGFASFDGPLRQYKQAIFSFKRRAALIILHTLDAGRANEIQIQANLQLPDNLKKQVVTTNHIWYNLWKIATQVQTVFQD